jgi:hypothetical protein
MLKLVVDSLSRTLKKSLLRCSEAEIRPSHEKVFMYSARSASRSFQVRAVLGSSTHFPSNNQGLQTGSKSQPREKTLIRNQLLECEHATTNQNAGKNKQTNVRSSFGVSFSGDS